MIFDMEDSTLKPAVQVRRRRILKIFGVVCACVFVWFIVSSARRMYGTKQAIESALNLRELGGSLLRYTNDHSGHYPDRLSDLLRGGEDIAPDMFIVGWGSATPAPGKTLNERADQMDAGGHCSYAYLGAGLTVKDVTPDMVLMYEADGNNPADSQINCLFGDGHAEILSAPQAIEAIIKTVRQIDRLSTTQPTTQNASHTMSSD
jgi:prepilin-type processing-associated H-X9-DG protein